LTWPFSGIGMALIYSQTRLCGLGRACDNGKSKALKIYPLFRLRHAANLPLKVFKYFIKHVAGYHIVVPFP